MSASDWFKVVILSNTRPSQNYQFDTVQYRFDSVSKLLIGEFDVHFNVLEKCLLIRNGLKQISSKVFEVINAEGFQSDQCESVSRQCL